MASLLLRSNVRLILRNKLLSAVKMTGLAIGAAIFLLTTKFCVEELSYDKQHSAFKRIYRYVHRVSSPEGMQSFAFTSATTGPALKERFPEVETFTRIFFPRISVRNASSDVLFNEKKFGFADANFLAIFNFPLANSLDAGRVLTEPLSLVLTPAMAEKYFGKDDPMGKTLLINGELPFVVKGILREEPGRTHFDFDFIASFSSLEVIKNHPVISKQIPASMNLETKGFAAFYTYLILSPGSSAESLEAKFPAFIEEFRGKGRSERLKPTLQSLSSIHLQSNLLYEIDQNGSTQVVYVYFSVGLLILIMACINYINTSTAEFINRAKGIGLKKILGVKRATLLWNHFSETVILTGLSLALGCGIVFVTLPFFNDLVARNLKFFTYETTLIVIGIFAITMLVSGVYPAWNITRANALESFKGTFQVKYSAFGMRNVLVFFQLLISFSLLTVSLLIYTQLDFLLKKDLGFDAHQVLTINATTTRPEDRQLLKDKMAAENVIASAGRCSTPPGESLFSLGITLPENSADEERRIAVYQSYVDTDYLRTLNIDLGLGRFFDAQNPADSTGYVVINQTAAAAIGDSILGRSLSIPDIFAKKPSIKDVIGIIPDFNFASLHSKIEPLILEYNPQRCGYFLVRFQGSDAATVINTLENIWRETVPTIPFDYYFLDDGFAKLYANDQRQKDVITCIAVIAVCLASLGIFGTTLFVVQQRTKEVCIRKMLGSERMSLLVLLFRPIAIILIFSCVVGIPVIIYVSNDWLQKYPYRIELSPVLFLASFLIIFIVIVGTILHHFMKVTSVNPTQVLRQLA